MKLEYFSLEILNFVYSSLRIEYREGVRILNENGIEMKDDEDLSTVNEKFLGKIIKQKVNYGFLNL